MIRTGSLATRPVFVLALKALCLWGRCILAEASPPANDPQTEQPADAERSLEIDDADTNMLSATISGPEYAVSDLFVGVEDVDHPRAQRLRDQYQLDSVVKGETDEFQKLLKLRHWVHSRWHIDNDQRFNGDVFSILEKAKAGEGFNCSHAMKVQHAVLTAMGFVVRDLGVQCNTEEYPDGFHHGVNEVWSNDLAKWVLMDGEYDFHFERDGVVLSALEAHQAAREGGKGVVKVQGPDRRVVPMKGAGFPFTSVIGYWWTAYHVRQNTFTQPSGNESRMVIFDNDAFRNTTWYRKGGDGELHKHWAYAADAFVPTREVSQIEWTPGVPKVSLRQIGHGQLEVGIRSVTPNLKATRLKTDRGPWRTLVGESWVWSLHPGQNRLEVQTRNLRDVDGPLVTVSVEFDSHWTPELMLQMKSISGVQVSPAGDRVTYAVRQAILQDDRSEYLSHIHVADLPNGNPRQLTQGDHSCHSPAWSPDGQHIAFVSSRSDKANVWIIPVDGGEARQLTEISTGVGGFRWSPDGNWIAFMAKEPDSPEREKADRQKDDARVVDEDVPRERLYVVSIDGSWDAPRPERLLTMGDYSVGSQGLRSGRPSFDWSPDSKQLVFSHTRSTHDDDWPSGDLSVVDLDTATVQPLVRSRAAEFSPLYSPDGKWIAYVASDDPPRWAGSGRVHLIQPGGGESRELAETFDGFSGYSDLIGWSADSQRIYFTELQRTATCICSLPLEGDPSVVANLAGKGAQMNLNGNRKWIGFTLESNGKAVEAYVSPIDDFQATQTSDVNCLLSDTPVGTTQVIRWNSSDGHAIEGLLTYPREFPLGEPCPLLVIAHGGPMGAFVQEFSGAPNPYPIAVWADRGYAILRPNVRGSSGYGQAFRYANSGDWGGMDYQDLLSGVDHVIAEGVADPNRLGVMGWSYGGFMTAWVITHTDRFRAASVGAGVTNLMSFTGATDIHGFLPDYFGTHYWEDLQIYREHSPMFHVKGVTTPTLMQHGENDRRVPLSQSQELYDALKTQGCQTQMVVYPRCAHGISEPRLMLDAMQRNIAWFDRYVGQATPQEDSQ